MSATPTRTRSIRNRRPGIHPGRRFALALGLTVTVAAALSFPESAAFGDTSAPLVTATVYPSNGGAPQTESLSVAQAQGSCPASSLATSTLQEYKADGSMVSVALGSSVWDLGTILDTCMAPAIPASEIHGVTVFGGNGPQYGNGQLGPGDLSADGANNFQDPGQTPVVSTNGGAGASAIEYDRPWRGPGDANFSDQVVDTSGSPIQVAVYTGPLLTVAVTASATQIGAGSTITFSTSVNPTPGTPSYSWSFGGGVSAGSTAASPTETFSTPGTYAVTAQVTDSDGSGGVGEITVTVGNPPASPAPTKTGPAAPSTSSSPTTTPTPPTHKPTKSKSTKQPGSAGTQGGSHEPSAPTVEHPGAGSTTTSSLTTSTTSTAPTPAGGGSGGSSFGDGSPPATPILPTTPETPTTAPSTQTGTPVDGYLIANVDPVPAGSSPLVTDVAAPTGAAIATGTRHVAAHSPWAIIGSLAAVLGLLCLGAGRELRDPVDWRTLRPHRSR